MGADFESKKSKNYQKYLEKKATQLKSPDLFTCKPNEQPRIVIIDPINGETFENGEKLLVCRKKEQTDYYKDLQLVASETGVVPYSSNNELEGDNFLMGIVENQNSLSKKVEVSLWTIHKKP